jgi:hypothetical protein
VYSYDCLAGLGFKCSRFLKPQIAVREADIERLAEACRTENASVAIDVIDGMLPRLLAAPLHPTQAYTFEHLMQDRAAFEQRRLHRVYAVAESLRPWTLEWQLSLERTPKRARRRVAPQHLDNAYAFSVWSADVDTVDAPPSAPVPVRFHRVKRRFAEGDAWALLQR